MVLPIDYKILRRLMIQGRTAWADLAQDLHLTPAATRERVRKLEDARIIRGYAAMVDAERVGYPLTAFIGVTLEHPKFRKDFLYAMEELTEVVECHHVCGDDDYLLKARTRSTRDLDLLLTFKIKGVPGVVRTRTTVVLASIKETPFQPVAVYEEKGAAS